MTTSPKSVMEDSLGESWVDLSEHSFDRLTPLPSVASLHLYNGDMAKLLWEAQKESNHSSGRVSGASSRKGSPKSPPNSPNSESTGSNESAGSDPDSLNDVYINPDKGDLLESVQINTTDWVRDWSSRPDQLPPKEWNFRHPIKTGLSMRHSKAMKNKLFSAEVFSLVLLTNLVSLILGTGFGFYLGKKLSVQVVPVALD